MADEAYKRNIAVGLTAAAGVVGLVALLLLFGYVPAFFETGYTYRIKLKESGGLYRDSRVTYYGIDIGKVTDVSLRGESGAGVLAEILIDRRLTNASVPQVKATSLLGGGSIINFTDQAMEEGQVALLPTDGTAVLEGEIGSPVDGITQTLTQAVDTFESLSTRLDTLMTTWDRVGQNIENLTADRDLDAIDAGEQASNLASVLARTETSLVEAKATMAAFRELLEDEQLLSDVRATASNARKLTDRAETTLVTIEDKLTTTADNLNQRITALADDLSGTVATATALLGKANDGQGTLGRMLNDPAIYDNLNDAAERLKALLLEARLLLEKIEGDGLWSSL